MTKIKQLNLNLILFSCNKCNGVLRPHVVWFNESLDPNVVEKIVDELQECDLFLIVSLFLIKNFLNKVQPFTILTEL